MKIFLDLAPAVAFLAALLLGDIYVATAVLIASLWIALLAYRLIYGNVRKSHLLIAASATLLGGMTLYLHNEIFIKWKPTLVYAVFALGMLGNRLLGRQPFMQKALHEAFDMPDELWRRVELAWVGFWVLCGLLNLYVAYHFSAQAWGVYKIVSAFALPVAFMLLHLPFIGRHLRQTSTEAS